VNDDRVKRILVAKRPIGESPTWRDDTVDYIYNRTFRSLNINDLSEQANEFDVTFNKTEMKKEYFSDILEYEYIDDIYSPFDASAGTSLLSYSPSNKWVAMFWGGTFLLDGSYKDRGRTVGSDLAIDSFILINTETKQVRRIGSRYVTYYERYEIRESGPLYFILKWENDNELYLLEQTKDEDMVMNGSQVEFYPGIGLFKIQVPKATARVVKLSLDDFTITEVEGIKPPHPWVCYSDHTTGVTGYIGMQDGTEISQNNTFLNPYPSIITNLDCSKQWVVNELNFEEFGIEFVSTRLAGSGYINDELYAFLSVTHKITETEILEEQEVIPEVFKSVIYALNIETGELTRITNIEDNLSIFGTYCASDKNKKEVYFILDNDVAETYQVVRIDDDFSLKTLSKCSYADYPYEFKDKNTERFFIY